MVDNIDMMHLYTIGLLYEMLAEKLHCVLQQDTNSVQALLFESTMYKTNCNWPVWEIWICIKCTVLFLVIGQPTSSTVRHFNKELRSNYWLNRCCVLISGHSCHVNQQNSKELIHFALQGWHLLRYKPITSFADVMYYCSLTQDYFSNLLSHFLSGREELMGRKRTRTRRPCTSADL